MVMQELNLKKFMAKIALDHFKEFQGSLETMRPLTKYTAVDYGRGLPAELSNNRKSLIIMLSTSLDIFLLELI